MLARHTQHINPPHPSEHYIKNAVAGPDETEPWADGLDEADPREMAMGRFRARQEIMAEVFGPEPISASFVKSPNLSEESLVDVL